MTDYEKYNYLIGENIGDLHIENVYHKNPRFIAHCKCNICGFEKDIQIGNLLRNIGISHKACAYAKFPRRINKIFLDMKARCENPLTDRYPSYGGRGITCTWKDRAEFCRDMLESYNKAICLYGEENVSLERLDVNGNYCKENCIWIDKRKQVENKRYTVFFKAFNQDGIVHYGKNLVRFCKEHHQNIGNMFAVMNGKQCSCRGWRVKRISKEEYEEHIMSHPVDADMDYLFDLLYCSYNSRRNREDCQSDRGIRIPRKCISSPLGYYVSEDAIKVLCTWTNKYDLHVEYDKKKDFFYVREHPR